MTELREIRVLRKSLLAVVLSSFMLAAGCGEQSTGESDRAGSVQNGSATASVPAESADAGRKNQAAERKVIKIAYLPITHALTGFELAEESKLRDLGFSVELVRFGSWTELIDALNAGKVDGAVALVELIMKAKEQGIDVHLASLAHHDGNVMIIGSNYSSMADLKGKTVAVPHRQSTHYLLLNDALARENLTVADVNVIEMAPPEMPSALASGQIAGYCVAEPFGARAVTLNLGKVLYQSKDLWPDSVCCGFALSGRFVAENPELAARLLEAIKVSGDSLDKDRSHASEVAARYLNVPGNVLDLSLQWISFSNPEISKEQYDILRDKAVKYGLSENPPLYEDIVVNVR